MAHGLTGVFRPAVAGCAVSTPGRSYGTFGCLVRDPVENGAVYVLSAAHVIAANGFGPVGIPLLQPGVQPSPGRMIGQLVRWGELDFSDNTFPNLFDAAITAVALTEVVPSIHGVGRPRGFSTHIEEGMIVQKCGATTGHTKAKVLKPSFACSFDYLRPDGTPVRAGFPRQVLCDRFSEKGDSGAAVLNENREIVGLLLGAAGGGSVFSPIAPILTRFGVAIA